MDQYGSKHTWRTKVAVSWLKYMPFNGMWHGLPGHSFLHSASVSQMNGI